MTLQLSALAVSTVLLLAFVGLSIGMGLQRQLSEVRSLAQHAYHQAELAKDQADKARQEVRAAKVQPSRVSAPPPPPIPRPRRHDDTPAIDVFQRL